jgi:S1-C subfamily serine protease
VPLSATSLTTVDWVALGVVVLAALAGWRRGLVFSALSLAGLAAGAYVGSRVAPHLLHGGASSQWAPAASLVGAILGAAALQTAAGIAGSAVRGGLRLTPLRLVDSAGGLILGAVAGLALVWVAAATALLAPGQTQVRSYVLKSQLVRQLDSLVPPRTLLHLLARIDPFPSIAGPAGPALRPSTGVLRDPVIRAAATRVVKVLGTACGVGVEGSGWFARRDLVVTAAHVVAGERDTIVRIPGVRGNRRAIVVGFDVRNDVAVLRIPGAGVRPLPLAEPRDGAAVAILGYPEDGPLRATSGRIGRTGIVYTQDARGHGPVPRSITAVAGRVQHGDSGGPAVDRSGAVQSTLFAARIGAPSGFGVPAEIVRRDLEQARRPLSTGSCS